MSVSLLLIVALLRICGSDNVTIANDASNDNCPPDSGNSLNVI